MTYSEDQIKAMVRRVLVRTLGPNGIAGAAPARQTQVASRASRDMITEADVLAAPVGTSISVAAETVVTPLARDTARERRIEIVQEPSGVLQAASELPAGERAVALGADHGGYAMKEDLEAYVSELGYATVDCGTHSTSSVDYPDQAYAVAQMVSSGRAWRGIIVDGAGIGSCMAANKVPGVRAAMCYDHATAFNSREHNDANVLTLGGVLVGSNLARQIVKVWLETDFGGGRHARRVDKIMEIEGRFLNR
jgi:ribose 5-phosphate isomerase B